MSSLSRNRLSPAECVALLEEAACGDESAAASALREVVRHADGAHPKVTDVTLQLLHVHPRATIPHIPDIISASSADVAAAVEAFGDILPSDRGLLVPMLGALADMPLTRSHEAAARATLRFALHTVDSDDVPAVARALLRCAKSPALARAAVATLRNALTRDLPQHAGALLAIVVAEHARARTHVGKALRAPAVPYPTASGLDLVVWLLCLQRARAAFDAIGDGVTEVIRSAVRAGALLSAAPHSLEAQVDMACRAAAESPQGVVSLLSTVVEAVPQDAPVVEINALVLFVRRLLKWCPAAVTPSLSLISHKAVGGNSVAVAVLLGLAMHVPASSFVTPHPVPIVAVVLAARGQLAQLSQQSSSNTRNGACSPGWNELFVRVRKGLVFGAQQDRISAIRMAYRACDTNNVAVILQLVELMASIVPSSLTDPLATSFLVVVGRAILKGAVDATLAMQLFKERFEREAPKDLIVMKNEESIQGRTATIHIDLAAVKDENPNTVAVVTGTGLALKCQELFEVGGKNSVFSLVINATVLVPVVCLPLYEAAQYLAGVKKVTENEPDDVSGAGSDGESEYSTLKPACMNKIESLTTTEFEEALEGCIISIAALTGLINTACVAFPATFRMLKIRHNPILRAADGVWQDDMWSLLDRMSELLLLMEAVQFAQTGIALDVEEGSESDDEGTTMLKKISPALKKRVADVIAANSSRPECSNKSEWFPVLSTNSTISLLVAVPDEKLLPDVERCQSDIALRDSELSRLEEFLLSRLFHIVRGPIPNVSETKKESEVTEFQLPDISEEEVARIARDCAEGKDDAFITGLKLTNVDDILQNSSRKRRRTCGSTKDSWASPLVPAEDELYVEHMFRTSCAVFEESLNTADLLYTPAMAALLLDRAVTNVTVASQRRRKRTFGTTKRDDLRPVCRSAGFALRLLAHLLVTSAAPDTIDKFTLNMGRHLASNFVKIAVDGLLRTDDDDRTLGKVVKALVWIVRTSIDAATSALAIDCIAVLAEFGVIDAGGFREEVWKSTDRLCEYNESALWVDNDIVALFGSNIQTWIMRSRRAGNKPKCEDEIYANGPWLTMRIRATESRNFVSGYRLTQLLNGMALQDAACEACAIVEELLEFVLAENQDAPEEGMSSERRRKGRVRREKRRVFEVLTVIEIVLDAVQTGFAHLRSLQYEALDVDVVTLAYWWLRAAKVITAVLNEVAGADRYVSGMASVVTNARAVVDGLLTMYNSVRTDVASLEAKTIREMKEIGGFLTECSNNVTKMANMLKKNSVAGAMDARRRTAVMRAKSGVPRLEGVVDSVRRIVVAFTRSVGKPSRIMANVKCGDGVLASKRRRGEDAEEAESDVEVDEVAEHLAKRGFHSTVEGEAVGTSKVVSFRNQR